MFSIKILLKTINMENNFLFVILSIKPKYIEKIKNNDKIYEFRKNIFSNKKISQIELIFIYSSYPIKKIVAQFKMGNIIKDTPKKIWEKCKELSGLKKKDFFNYFGTRDSGYAIEMREILFFKESIDPFSLIPNFIAPQNFSYFTI